MWEFIAAVWQTLTSCARRKIDNKIEEVIEAHEAAHPRPAPPVIINISMNRSDERRHSHQKEAHVGHKRHPTMYRLNG